MDTLKTRLIIGISFAVTLILVTVIMILVGGRSDWWGFSFRIVGILLFLAFLGTVLYELLKAHNLPIIVMIMYFIFAIFIVWLGTDKFWFDKEQYKLAFDGITDSTYTFRAIDYITNIFKFSFTGLSFYIAVLVMFLISISIFITKNQIENKKAAALVIFYRSLLLTFSIVVLAISIRTASLLLFLDWRYFIMLFILPSLGDTFAYFAGVTTGKKLIKVPFAPHISPSKSWEGVFVGFIVMVAIVAGFIYGLKLFETADLFKQYGTEASRNGAIISVSVLLMLFLPIAAIGGDLYFSLVKRIYGIKDYSNILKSHGGFLDRYDSVSFVMFTFTIIMIIQ